MNGAILVLRESSTVIARGGEAPTRQSHDYGWEAALNRLLRSFHSLAMTRFPLISRPEAPTHA
jgi:hypothetical protein